MIWYLKCVTNSRWLKLTICGLFLHVQANGLDEPHSVNTSILDSLIVQCTIGFGRGCKYEGHEGLLWL